MSWEGRPWVDASPIILSDQNLPKLRIISLRVYSDFKTAFMHHSAHKSWEYRAKILLQELLSYDADIYCLQDLDHYQDFWYPKLMNLGFDTIYKQKTSEKDYNYDGLMIAVKRVRLQIFKSVTIEFNDAVKDDSRGSVFKERCRTDDVAQIAIIQCNALKDLPSSVCIVNCMLNELISNQDVRIAHSIYLAKEIEKANKDFQAPVVLCANLNDPPSSGPYALFRTGRVPLVAQAPPPCLKVHAIPTSRASALVKWIPPKMSIADPGINAYRISWRPGGSTILSYRSQVEASAGDCIKYVESFDENNRRRVVACDVLQLHISGLCSDIPYEFRVCGVNDVGEGPGSEPSLPLVLPNPDRAPKLPAIEHFNTLEQVKESREFEKMMESDSNVHKMFIVDPVNAATQLTPRETTGAVNKVITQGRVLPPQINSRIGWKDDLGGQIDADLEQELHREYILSKSILRDHEGFKHRPWNHYDDHKIESDYLKINPAYAHIAGRDGSTLILDGKEVMNHLGAPNRRHVHSMLLRSAYEAYSSSGEPMFTVCKPKEKDMLAVECVDYIFYSTSGFAAYKVLALPAFSMLKRGETPEERYTVMDINHYDPFPCLSSTFEKPLERIYDKMGYREDHQTSNKHGIVVHKHSKADIHQMKRLLKDQLVKSHGVKASKTSEVYTHGNVGRKSSMMQMGDNGNKNVLEDVSGFWGGRWAPFPLANRSKSNYYLPNAAYSSTNFAIGVELVFDENLLPSNWKCGLDSANQDHH